MAQCWTSGGPFWLFGLTVYAGILVPVAAAWWVLAWSNKTPPNAAQPVSKILRGALPGLLLLGVIVVTWQGPPPSVVNLASWIGVAAITVGMVAVNRRRVTALAAGVGLTGRWQQAVIIARWGAPAVTIALVLAAVGAFTTYLAMGHAIPC